MNLDKMNGWLALLGNLGVILGIIFLAIELQNSTRATEAQTRDSLSAKLMDWQMALATDLDVAELWRVGNNGRQEFSEPREWTAYTQLIQSSFRLWENEYYQYKVGLYNDSEIEPRLVRWKGALQRLGMSQVWCLQRDAYAADFREILDSFVNESTSCETIIDEYRANRT